MLSKIIDVFPYELSQNVCDIYFASDFITKKYIDLNAVLTVTVT